ncbi:pseudouridine synthase [Corynebacterium propinquum]
MITVTENHSKATAESIAQELGADWIFADEPTNDHDHDHDHDAGYEAVRLQKVLSQAGVASRRHSEILIRDGRVQVNGKTITKQGVKVDPSRDIIHVDGARINVDEDKAYYVLNKPRGVQSTMSDEKGRRCVGDLVVGKLDAGERLFHVGRLDADTEGLLILTNDGELANRLMHPKYEVSKTYLAEVLGEAGPKLISTLREGVELEDGMAKADFVRVIDKNQGYSLVQVELHEGRKHIVRRMLKEAGYPVQRLVRTKVHTVQLGEQKPGVLRALNSSELTSLYKAVGM